MRVASGLMHPTILLVSDGADGGKAFKRIFAKAGYPVVTATSITEAVEMVASDLPHFIISAARLKDGHVNALWDRLHEDETSRRIPILVTMPDEKTPDRVALRERKYGAFFTGEPQPQACLLKLREVAEATRRPSPYFVAANKLTHDPTVKLLLRCKLLGLYSKYVALQAPFRLTPRMAVELMVGGQNLPVTPIGVVTRRLEGGGFVNFIPEARFAPDAAETVEKLTPLGLSRAGKPVALGTSCDRRVLVYHPDPDRGKRFMTALGEHGVEAVLVRDLLQATRHVVAEPDGFGCVFLYELLADAQRKDWTDMYNHLAPAARPRLVVGTQGQPPPSSEQVAFLKKPLEIEDSLLAIESMLEAVSLKFGPLAVSIAKGPGVAVSCRVDATLLGVDEQGGLLELSGRFGEGDGATLDAPGLTRLWASAQLVKLGSGGSAPDKPFTWQERFTLATAPEKVVMHRTLRGLMKGPDEPEPAPPPPPPAAAAAQAKGNLYDVKLINFFIQACNEVIEYYMGVLPQIGKPFLRAGRELPAGFVNGTSAVSGKTIKGATILTCERRFVAFLAERIAAMPPDQAAKDDAILADVLTELCDQVFGKARLLLETEGLEFDVALPEVTITQAAASAHAGGDAPVLVIPFTLRNTKFYVEVCFERV